MAKKTRIKKSDEKVMVVARSDLFKDGVWYGIKTENLKKYLNLISTKHRFLPRSQVEHDPSWQQVIPYLVFVHNDKIFLMRRKRNHTDLRLANLYSIGIGGHINKKDIKSVTPLRQAGLGSEGQAGTKSIKGIKGGLGIMAWAKREFEEEVSYDGHYKTEFLGLLNHDANDVGLVHVGLVIRVLGDSGKIAIRDEHKLGKLVSLPQTGKSYKKMETWSQIVYDFLMAEKTKSKKVVDISSGVLPDWLIRKYIEEGVIRITHLDSNWKSKIDQVSIDFHLGTNLKLFRAGAYRFIDTKRGLPEDAMEEINLQEGDPFILEPGAFAITSTKEILKLPKDILGRLEGKSSLARLGILVHSTAARFDPGWNGAPVLELGNLGPKPAILYCGMPICAFTFEKLSAPVEMGYEGSRSDRYSGSKKAVASKIEKHGRKKR